MISGGGFYVKRDGRVWRWRWVRFVACVWQREDEMAVCKGRLVMDRADGCERAVDGFAESGGDGGSVRWALVG
jgi:hypothetical protein